MSSERRSGHRSTVLALVAGMMVAVGVPSVGGPAVGLAAGPNTDQVDPELPSLELQAGDFVPAAGDRLPLPPELSGPDIAAGVRADWIVQFEGPVRQEWKDAVIAVGGELFGYLRRWCRWMVVCRWRWICIRRRRCISRWCSRRRGWVTGFIR